MTIELTFGLWMVPVGLMGAAFVWSLLHKPDGSMDITGALFMVCWLVARATEWAVWGLSWLL